MKKILLVLIWGYAAAIVASAQDSPYRDFRSAISTPPYSLEKVKRLINDTPEQETNPNEIPDGILKALSNEVYNQLTVREKFTYTMIHPEVYSQNCTIFVPQSNEENKIFGYLISWMDEETWSDRQIKFLNDNRDSVIVLIRESVNRSKRMGVNYKDALVAIKAWEIVPFLIDYFKSHKKDKDVLTTLMLLMKDDQYDEFIKSATYKKLYGNTDADYETAINYNSQNEELIIKRARNYFLFKSTDAKRKN